MTLQFYYPRKLKYSATCRHRFLSVCGFFIQSPHAVAAAFGTGQFLWHTRCIFILVLVATSQAFESRRFGHVALLLCFYVG